MRFLKFGAIPVIALLAIVVLICANPAGAGDKPVTGGEVNKAENIMPRIIADTPAVPKAGPGKGCGGCGAEGKTASPETETEEQVTIERVVVESTCVPSSGEGGGAQKRSGMQIRIAGRAEQSGCGAKADGMPAHGEGKGKREGHRKQDGRQVIMLSPEGPPPAGSRGGSAEKAPGAPAPGMIIVRKEMQAPGGCSGQCGKGGGCSGAMNPHQPAKKNQGHRGGIMQPPPPPHPQPCGPGCCGTGRGPAPGGMAPPQKGPMERMMPPRRGPRMGQQMRGRAIRPHGSGSHARTGMGMRFNERGMRRPGQELGVHRGGSGTMRPPRMPQGRRGFGQFAPQGRGPGAGRMHMEVIGGTEAPNYPRILGGLAGDGETGRITLKNFTEAHPEIARRLGAQLPPEAREKLRAFIEGGTKAPAPKKGVRKPAPVKKTSREAVERSTRGLRGLIKSGRFEEAVKRFFNLPAEARKHMLLNVFKALSGKAAQKAQPVRPVQKMRETVELRGKNLQEFAEIWQHLSKEQREMVEKRLKNAGVRPLIERPVPGKEAAPRRTPAAPRELENLFKKDKAKYIQLLKERFPEHWKEIYKRRLEAEKQKDSGQKKPLRKAAPRVTGRF